MEIFDWAIVREGEEAWPVVLWPRPLKYRRGGEAGWVVDWEERRILLSPRLPKEQREKAIENAISLMSAPHPVSLQLVPLIRSDADAARLPRRRQQ